MGPFHSEKALSPWVSSNEIFPLSDLQKPGPMSIWALCDISRKVLVSVVKTQRAVHLLLGSVWPTD